MNKPILAFCISLMLIGGVLFFLPINLFPGKIVDNSTGTTQILSAPLSLSYFVGIGYDPSDMKDIQDFYLTGKGYALAFCLLFGLPFIIALRFYYAKDT